MLVPTVAGVSSFCTVLMCSMPLNFLAFLSFYFCCYSLPANQTPRRLRAQSTVEIVYCLCTLCVRPRLQFSSVYAILDSGLPAVCLTRVAVRSHIYVDTAVNGLVACVAYRPRSDLRATARTLSAIQLSVTDRSAVQSAVHGHARSLMSVRRRQLTRLPVVSCLRRSTSAR